MTKKPGEEQVKPQAEFSEKAKSVMQQRAEQNERLRKQDRKERSAEGYKTDRGIGFTDLPYDVRRMHLLNHEQRWKRNYDKAQQAKALGASTTMGRVG